MHRTNSKYSCDKTYISFHRYLLDLVFSVSSDFLSFRLITNRTTIIPNVSGINTPQVITVTNRLVFVLGGAFVPAFPSKSKYNCLKIILCDT